jgi:hypothetical protein
MAASKTRSRKAAPRAARKPVDRAEPAERPEPGLPQLEAAASRTPKWLLPLLDKARERGRIKAEVIAARHPGHSRRQLGEALVRSSALRAGLVGAATGTLALITLPVGLPAGVAATLFIEAELLFALLALYELDGPEGDGPEGDGELGRVRLGALWVGAGFADAAKSAGLKMGANLIGRALAGTLPARLIARLEPALLRAILKRLGLGFVPRLLKLWPIIGAPFAFAIDRAALWALGKSALDTLEAAQAR